MQLTSLSTHLNTHQSNQIFKYSNLFYHREISMHSNTKIKDQSIKILKITMLISMNICKHNEEEEDKVLLL